MTITSRLIVHVQQPAGVAAQLIGRSAALVMWVVCYHDQINNTFRGTITFDWEGPSLRPRLERKFDRINTESLLPASDQAST